MDWFPYDRDLLKEFRSIVNDRLYQSFPANIYVLKVNNRNTRKRCEICSKLTIKIPEQRHWRRSTVFTVNLEHVSHLFSSVSIVDFEQVNVN